MSAPNLKEIEWAISELEHKESSETGYALLAALYTCRDKMSGEERQGAEPSAYSMAEGPATQRAASYGDSDFLATVSGKDPELAWGVMDDLMDTLRVVNRRVYDSVMRKLNNL